MEKKDIGNIYFRLNMFWQNAFYKNEESKTAYIKGFETACIKSGNEFYGPIELEEESVKRLALVIEAWAIDIPKNRNNITALLEGFSVTASPNFDTKKSPDSDYKHLNKRFSAFIYQEYKIRDFSWSAQVDTFAFRNNKEWDQSFILLFEEFLNYGPCEDTSFEIFFGLHLPLNSAYSPTVRKIDLGYHNKPEISMNDQTIKIGSVLMLGDLIGEDYKQAVHYDVKIRNPSWDLYDASAKDFKYVKLCYANFQSDQKEYSEVSVFERARRLCSGIRSKVRFITETDENIFVYTDCFEIDIKNALAAGEVVLIQDEINEHEEQTLHYHFNELWENYTNGLLTYSEVISRLYTDRVNSKHFPNPLPWIRWQLTLSGWHKVKRDGKRGEIR